MPEDVKIIVSDERSQEEGKKVEVIKNGEFIADAGEEIVQSLEEIQKDLEELSLRSIIEKDESIGEEDKEILKKSITDEGGLDFATLMKENVHRTVNDLFKDTSKGLYLLLPIFFTTDKDSIEHEMDLLDVTYEGITYYLKDEFKRLAQSLEGDEEYKLYLVDPVKLNDTLEGKELLIDGKNKKLDIFVEFLNIINSVEEMRDEEFGKLVTEKAYKSAVRLIYGKYLNDEKELKKLVENISKHKDSISNMEHVAKSKRSKIKEEKKKKTDISLIKGIFFKKIFKDRLQKGNVPVGLTNDFSMLLDTLAEMFILAYERNVLGISTELEEHIHDINNGKYNMSKQQVIDINYAIIQDLYHEFRDKKNRWAFVSIEKQLFEVSLDKSYLYEIFEEICRKIPLISL
jgi:hypothetical protein|nr:MAG TPA: hypothetical protein [Caudoviricetes sp.]